MDIAKISAEINEEEHRKGFWADGANVGEKLMLVVSELSEGLEAHRKGRIADIKSFLENLDPYNGLEFKPAFEKYIKDSLQDELADAVIRLLDLAYELGYDMEWHIQHKFNYNKLRPYKHGKAY